MGLVALIAWRKTRGEVGSADGYFLAGRGLSGAFIAGSLLLTNLSAEQLIGLNGSAFAFNMSSMAWEVTAGIAMIVMALVFLPRYLGGAFSTLPEFLEKRYDAGVRRLSAALFLVGYGLITIPSVLYSGALAVLRLFDVPGLLSVSHESALLVTIYLIGGVGGLYAVFGGLRAVAVSDTINGIGLLIVGAMVPLFGLYALGQGDIGAGIQRLVAEHPEKLNAIGTGDDPTPFGTLFTGMILANLFYWGTNQYVIQRTLAARDLAQGQKGVLLAGFFKLLVPFFMMLPGVIAYHLYNGELTSMDLAYPALVADVLPVYLGGFFLAVLLGAVFSSFNSLLNSAATLFCLDIYKPLCKKPPADETLIKVAKRASVVIAFFSFITAPMLQYAPEGLWQIIRIFTGFYNIPIITLVLFALVSKRVPPLAAKVCVIFHITAYAGLRFVWQIDLNFIHIYALLFAVEVVLMWAITAWRPVSAAATSRVLAQAKVDLTPWRWAIPASTLLVACIVALYLLFSPLGLASPDGANYQRLLALFAGLGILVALVSGLHLQRFAARYGDRTALDK